MLTSEQAQWLVTFYRNLPGQQLQHQAQTAYPAFEERSSVEHDRYPYFDMRQMNERG
jgi:hypothetical protein